MNLSKNNKRHETIMELSLSPLCNETWELSRMIKTLVYTLLPFLRQPLLLLFGHLLLCQKCPFIFDVLPASAFLCTLNSRAAFNGKVAGITFHFGKILVVLSTNLVRDASKLFPTAREVVNRCTNRRKSSKDFFPFFC